MVNINYFMLVPFALTACGGPSDETLLDELRVLAMVPAQPELAPLESTTVSTRVVDPLAEGFEALVWTCTSLGEGCLEDEEGRSVEVVAPTDGRVDTALSVSAALSYVASPEPLPLIAVWALACQPGLCPLLDDVASGAEIDPALWQDPLDWMDELPMTGVSLAFTTLYVSSRDPDERHQAPTLTGPTEALTVAPAGTLSLSATALGELGEEAKVWAYTEGGGFVSTDERPDADGVVLFDWVAPETAGEVPIYLLLVDGLGGSALWEGRVAVQ